MLGLWAQEDGDIKLICNKHVFLKLMKNLLFVPHDESFWKNNKHKYRIENIKSSKTKLAHSYD